MSGTSEHTRTLIAGVEAGTPLSPATLDAGATTSTKGLER